MFRFFAHISRCRRHYLGNRSFFGVQQAWPPTRSRQPLVHHHHHAHQLPRQHRHAQTLPRAVHAPATHDAGAGRLVGAPPTLTQTLGPGRARARVTRCQRLKTGATAHVCGSGRASSNTRASKHVRTVARHGMKPTTRARRTVNASSDRSSSTSFDSTWVAQNSSTRRTNWAPSSSPSSDVARASAIACWRRWRSPSAWVRRPWRLSAAAWSTLDRESRKLRRYSLDSPCSGRVRHVWGAHNDHSYTPRSRTSSNNDSSTVSTTDCCLPR